MPHCKNVGINFLKFSSGNSLFFISSFIINIFHFQFHFIHHLFHNFLFFSNIDGFISIYYFPFKFYRHVLRYRVLYKNVCLPTTIRRRWWMRWSRVSSRPHTWRILLPVRTCWSTCWSVFLWCSCGGCCTRSGTNGCWWSRCERNCNLQTFWTTFHTTEHLHPHISLSSPSTPRVAVMSINYMALGSEKFVYHFYGVRYFEKMIDGVRSKYRTT